MFFIFVAILHDSGCIYEGVEKEIQYNNNHHNNMESNGIHLEIEQNIDDDWEFVSNKENVNNHSLDKTDSETWRFQIINDHLMEMVQFNTNAIENKNIFTSLENINKDQNNISSNVIIKRRTGFNGKENGYIDINMIEAYFTFVEEEQNFAIKEIKDNRSNKCQDNYHCCFYDNDDINLEFIMQNQKRNDSQIKANKHSKTEENNHNIIYPE